MRKHLGAHLVLLGGGLIMVSPFVYQVLATFMTNDQITSVPPTLWPTEWDLGAYAAVFAQIPFLRQLLNTVVITVLTTVATLVLCALGGYAFARMRFYAKGPLFALVLTMLMVPGTLLLIPQYQTVQSFGWLDSFAGIVVPGLVNAFGIFMMRQFFLGLPRELEEAARLDGANPGQVFWHVMLPLARPGLSALAILTVMASWSSLLWPLVVVNSQDMMPLSVGLASFTGEHGTQFPSMLAASLMAMLPIVILFLVMQRRVIEGIAFSGLK
ncbi:carbohydrate ABC transporter permease [Sinosporangium siamense]|uniref:Sugar ABC transporter permease n=1 Tax=Sinosporangium siamense TaxID=1367973 RepID=A0A919VG66_9ACTN|nr:carbohydrate ABC transporter permease [Sinosporangium siamense]GII96799.1 sugar ABC transporter permease [Sinosporangium siamense]